MAILEVQNLVKNFGSLQVLKGIDFETEKGQVTAILGPSGSGKSTFIRCLNRLEKITSGKISIDNEVLADTQDGKVVYAPEKEARRICGKTGMVFQSFNLFPHMTVIDNITAAPITVQKRSQAEAEETAAELLKRVGLLEKAKQYPSSLSGGQQQRVAIARALALKPEILFFDEPTSALDPELTGEVLRVIRDLAAEHMTMLIVTHEIEFALGVADRVVFMDGGHIVESGTADALINHPKNERTRAFLNRMHEV
ncbi:MAG: amino acid ABC transporter ATP-binding protein [Ruminococcaceae bacterium]|nr:amino acid ABC transporter ATP-binding protein [Oscillospiraceae bacterium]